MANIIRRGERDLGLPTVFDPFRLFMRDFLGADQDLSTERSYIPDVEVKETKNAYVFHADLPGIKESDLDISIQNNRLMITGKREHEQQEEDERYYAYERCFGSFSRSFVMPEGAELDKIEAHLRDGVLNVTIPKKAETLPKKVPIAIGKPVEEPKLQKGQKAA
jgi:HSP20 family protein